MDKSYFLGGNATFHQLFPHVVVHGEIAGGKRDDGIHVCGHGRIFAAVVIRFHPLGIFRVIRRFSPRLRQIGGFGGGPLATFGRGQVAKNKLRTLVAGGIAPDVVYPLDRRIELGTFKIIGCRLDKPEVQPGLAGVIGDLERVVDARVFGKVLHAGNDTAHIRCLIVGTLHHRIDGLAAPDRRRQRPLPGLFRLVVQIALGHDIGKGTVHGEQLRYILKLGKAAF